MGAVCWQVKLVQLVPTGQARSGAQLPATQWPLPSQTLPAAHCDEAVQAAQAPETQPLVPGQSEAAPVQLWQELPRQTSPPVQSAVRVQLPGVQWALASQTLPEAQPPWAPEAPLLS